MESACDMSCFMPLDGWMGRKANDSGKYPVVFSLHDGWSDRPVSLPCGKCLGCLADKARAWSVRCYHESTQHDQNCFVTLTYNDEHCPDQVNKKDLQDLFKRLRNEGLRFRYFACGEYGGRFGRPHYHVLFFGQDFLGHSRKLGLEGEYYTNPLLDEVWGKGHVTIAPCEPGSVFYVAGYSLKNIGVGDAFALQSRRPYIGAGWLQKYHDDIVRNGFVVIEGKRVPIPPAYLKRPELSLEMEPLIESRREFVRTASPDEAVRRRECARAKELNLAARIAHKKVH